MVRRLTRLEHTILLVEGLSVLISAELHLLEFLGLPTVHFQRAHEGNVYAESAVGATALVAQKNTDAGGRPFRVLAAAIEAHFVLRQLCELLKDRIAFFVWYVIGHF